MNIMVHALRYAGLGWRVFPGPVGRKPSTTVPMMRCWPELATTDPAVIAQWWTRTPSANLCAATGRSSGFWVLDVDEHKPEASGSASLAALERQHSDLPLTLTNSTPSGGVHHLFSFDGIDFELPSKIGWRPGLDVLAEGGRCILLPPSVTETGRYVGLVDAPVAAAPAWLIDMLRPVETYPRQSGVVAQPAPGDVVGLLRWLAAVQPGSQDRALCWVVRTLRDEGVTPQDAGDMLWPVVAQWPCSREPWTERDIERHLRSAYKGAAA